MKVNSIGCLTLSLLLVSSSAFTTVSRTFTSSRSSNAIDNLSRPNLIVLQAKKAQTESKGFSPKKVKPVKVEVEDEVVVEGEEKARPITGLSKSAASQNFDGETDADAIFKKYGIKDGQTAKSKSSSKSKKANKKKNRKGEVEESPFGQSVLANIPAETQLRIDNTLVALVSASLGFVVLSGISISLGAYTVVFPETKIPEWLDGLITNFLSPAFTPALGIFFFFSTTFGLFKFAQISSDQTVYKEEVTRDL